MLNLYVKRLSSTALLPVKGTAESACWDLSVDKAVQDELGWTVHTGLAVALPPGYGMFIFPRSGLGTKFGLTLRNSTGVIDSDYRGEILLKFHPGFASTWAQEEILHALRPGNRIAQATVLQIPEMRIVETNQLPETTRGTGGFGSTGV